MSEEKQTRGFRIDRTVNLTTLGAVFAILIGWAIQWANMSSRVVYLESQAIIQLSAAEKLSSTVQRLDGTLMRLMTQVEERQRQTEVRQDRSDFRQDKAELTRGNR